MPVVSRPARAQELERAEQLVVASINDLTKRHGFGRIASSRAPDFQAFSLRDDPNGVWVAEDAGQIVGFALSWVCGDLWFLAELFVSPAYQGRGIGNQLLKQTLEHAQNTGTTNKALITFTFNTVSQGLYIRHGLFPRHPIYLFKIGREMLRGQLRSACLRFVALEGSSSNLQTLASVDAHALGISREKHHRYLLNDGTMRGVLLYAEDECAGYAYINADGHIGPLAVVQPNFVGPAFRTALRLAAESSSSSVSAFIPGPNGTTLGIAVEHGMRIALPMVLMSTHDFGDWTQYLPRNPGFM